MTSNPWNKNKSLGQKTALNFEQVQAIKTILVSLGTHRDRALFSLAIDSSLRGRDLLSLRVSDVMDAEGVMRPSVRVKPSKTKHSTGASIVFEPIPYTMQMLKELIAHENKQSYDFLFTRARPSNTPLPYSKPISTRAYQSLVKQWVGYVGLNRELYGTHSLRRTRPAHIYAQTKNLRACQIILGHSNITSTQVYLGIESTEALEIARKWQM